MINDITHLASGGEHRRPNKPLTGLVSTSESESFIIKPDEVKAKVVQPWNNAQLNLITDTEVSKSPTLWVIMDKYCTTVIQLPGVNTPFNTTSHKYAKSVAREVGNGAHVVKYRDALKLVATSPCNLPHDHPQYNADKRAAKIKIP